jgi:hypothetical protein
MAETSASDVPDGVSGFLLKWKDGLVFLSSIAAISYTVGYTITSMHFQKYHIHNPTLIHARYLSVGVCFFFILAVTFVPGCYLKSIQKSLALSWMRSRQGRDRWLLRAFLRRDVSQRGDLQTHEAAANRLAHLQTHLDRCLVRMTVFSLSVVCSLGVILLLSTQLTLEWNQFRHVQISVAWLWFYGWRLLIGWYLSVFLSGALLREIMDGTLIGQRMSIIPPALGLAGAWSVVLLLVLFASESYASYIYAQINEAWGGGQEVQVQLILDPAQADKKPPIPLEGSSRSVSISVEMLEQTDKSYVVLVRRYDAKEQRHYKEAVELDKTIVKGTLFEYSGVFREPKWMLPSKPESMKH